LREKKTTEKRRESKVLVTIKGFLYTQTKTGLMVPSRGTENNKKRRKKKRRGGRTQGRNNRRKGFERKKGMGHRGGGKEKRFLRGGATKERRYCQPRKTGYGGEKTTEESKIT